MRFVVLTTDEVGLEQRHDFATLDEARRFLETSELAEKAQTKLTGAPHDVAGAWQGYVPKARDKRS
jgi:hypothetical protein